MTSPLTLSFGSDHGGLALRRGLIEALKAKGTTSRLGELHRVLKPGGRIILFEPAAGLLGRVVLGLFHHEPLALAAPITWSAPAGFDPRAVNYYAAQGNAWRLFGRAGQTAPLAEIGLRPSEVSYFPALPWLLTGGFRGDRKSVV